MVRVSGGGVVGGFGGCLVSGFVLAGWRGSRRRSTARHREASTTCVTQKCLTPHRNLSSPSQPARVDSTPRLASSGVQWNKTGQKNGAGSQTRALLLTPVDPSLLLCVYIALRHMRSASCMAFSLKIFTQPQLSASASHQHRARPSLPFPPKP